MGRKKVPNFRELVEIYESFNGPLFGNKAYLNDIVKQPRFFVYGDSAPCGARF